MSVRIHPTAVVHPHARLGDGVVVGPFCSVGAEVTIGAHSRLISHVSVEGPAVLGTHNTLHPFAALGGQPQDRSYDGEHTLLEVGDGNVFREQVTVHRGTRKGGGVTRIGARCLFMVGAHVAHDVSIADDVILANLTTLAGHVVVERRVVCGGHVAVAPYVRLGQSSFLAGGAKVESDVPPFMIAAGDRARVRVLNRVGLKRAGAPLQSRLALKRAFRMLWRSGEPRQSALERVRAELAADDYVRELVEFLSKSARP